MEQSISFQFQEIVSILSLLNSAFQVDEFRACGFDVQCHDFSPPKNFQIAKLTSFQWGDICQSTSDRDEQDTWSKYSA